MNKYIMNFSYNGSNYSGYAMQPNKNTIQDMIEEALIKLNSNEKVTIFATSRTDAKVHAKDQYAQFYLNQKMVVDTLKIKLNKMLPEDIVVLDVIEDHLDLLNVRYDVKSKSYKYIIALEKNPFLYNFSYYINYDLNISKMKLAAKFFVGTHDFSAVSNANTDVIDKVRTINYLKLKEVSICNTRCIEVLINANGYLYNMVRIIVGCLIEVGRGKITPESISGILKGKKRDNNCICAPAQGLFLEKTQFKDENEKYINSRR